MNCLRRIASTWSSWPPARGDALRSAVRTPLTICIAVGLVVAQASAALDPQAGAGPALGAGLKALLLGWTMFTLVDAVWACLRGVRRTRVPVIGGLRVTATAVCALTIALLVAALQRSPSRLAVNVMGFGLVALPVVWVAQHRAGPATAARVAGALAVVALVPTNINLTRVDLPEQAGRDSGYLWTVGWVSDGWLLRHKIRLASPATHGVTLVIPLASAYNGGSRVIAAVNGRGLGPARFEGKTMLRVEVPAGLIAGQTLLSFELQQQPPDRSLRLRAQRWTSGATMGAAASSYFDGQHWWSGTFNDEAGRRQEGVYLVRLETAS